MSKHEWVNSFPHHPEWYELNRQVYLRLPVSPESTPNNQHVLGAFMVRDLDFVSRKVSYLSYFVWLNASWLTEALHQLAPKFLHFLGSFHLYNFSIQENMRDCILLCLQDIIVRLIQIIFIHIQGPQFNHIPFSECMNKWIYSNTCYCCCLNYE